MVPHVKLTIYNSTQPLIIAPSSKIATSYFFTKESEGTKHRDTWEESIPRCGNSKCRIQRQELKEQQGSKPGWRRAGGRWSGEVEAVLEVTGQAHVELPCTSSCGHGFHPEMRSHGGCRAEVWCDPTYFNRYVLNAILKFDIKGAKTEGRSLITKLL